MKETRRGFLRKIGSMIAVGFPVAALLDGCASAALPVYRYDSRGGPIDLYLKWYPELQATGGVIELLVGGEVGSVFVVRLSFSRIAALSPACPDDGCRVKLEKNHFNCPCGGSTYELDGTPVTGQAGGALRSFRTQYLDTSVRIFLS